METKDTMSPTAGPATPGAGAGTGPKLGDTHAGKVAADTRAVVDREVQDARERASAGAGDVKREAMGAGDRIAGLASEQAEIQKDEASKTLRTFADAVRSASEELGAQDQSMSANLVRQAAEGLESLSGSLDSRSVSGMTRSVSDFGRTNPGMFLAGCLLAGLAAGRFMTASSDEADDYDDYAPARPRAGYGYGGPQAPRPSASDPFAPAPASGMGGAAATGPGGIASGVAGTGTTHQAGRFEGLSQASGDDKDPLNTRVDVGAPAKPARQGGSNGDL